MRKPLVVGNWKMNGSLSANAELLIALVERWKGAEEVDCAVCVPFPYLAQTRALVNASSIACGAQNLDYRSAGAYTGEVSASMLRDFGCEYVIVGHSERRQFFAEDDQIVAMKFEAALQAGITPILCVGETLAQREAGETERIVKAQFDAVVMRVGVEALARGVVAYEPVWAIGTGRTATPEQAQAVHMHVRSLAAGKSAAVARDLRILYGGSVKAVNAATLFGQSDIDGGLIGGASLVASEFLSICEAARPKVGVSG